MSSCLKCSAGAASVFYDKYLWALFQMDLLPCGNTFMVLYLKYSCRFSAVQNPGIIFIIYRSFLSSSSTEYGIARLPQPVPMEMCVLRVPW